MRALVCHGVADIRVEDVPEPKIQEDCDLIVRVTTSAICGTGPPRHDAGDAGGHGPGHEGVGAVGARGRGCATCWKATGSSSLRRSHAGRARTAARVTTLPMRQHEPERPAGRDGVRRSADDRTVPRYAGGKGARTLRQCRAGQAARRRSGRAAIMFANIQRRPPAASKMSTRRRAARRRDAAQPNRAT